VSVLLGIVCAVLGSLGPCAYGQEAAPAPVPEIRITGFLDTITTWTKNFQDTLIHRTGDKEWYARNRGRVDVVGQLGSARAVLGLEIDSVWGQVSGADNNLAAGGVNPQRSGASSAFDLNTDTQGSIEVKWLYTEFPLPLTPFPVLVRLGAQPFQTGYKLGAYATGDFAGVNLDLLIRRNVRAHLTYVALEENLTGGRRALGFGRGDDWALIATVEVEPLRGLEIQPLYSFVQLYGSSATRSMISSGLPPGSPITFTRANPGGALGVGQVENRHTLGVDSRWRSGPFSLEPTVYYQFGTRDTDNPFIPASSSDKSRITEARLDAWFVDIIGGWRVGSLLLEGRYMYTTGNRPRDQLNRDVNYYQPLGTDTSYWSAGWSEIYGLGIDYFNGSLKGMGTVIGMDRYGRQQFAVRAIYSVTPDLDLRGVVSPGWTARSVDTDGQGIFIPFQAGAATVCNTAATGKSAGCKGDATYIGTEVALGLTWRFAPGLVFDLAGAMLFAGSALDASEVLNGVLTKMKAKDIYLVSGRVRYSF
jgi:hypothetical protein